MWQVKIAMTESKLPKIWRFGPRGLACFGYSGRGIGPATVFGQRVATALLDQAEDMLPIAPTNDNAISAPVLKSSVLEAGATLYHVISDRI